MRGWWLISPLVLLAVLTVSGVAASRRPQPAQEVVDPLEREANPRLLRRLAQATGDESFFPREVNALEDVLRETARDIRNSYPLGYVSSNSSRDGAYRFAVTDLNRRSLVVRARDGYRGGGPSRGR
jgi:hypothetical protein